MSFTVNPRVINIHLTEDPNSIRKCMGHGHLPNGEKVVFGALENLPNIEKCYEVALKSKDSEAQFQLGNHFLAFNYKKAFEMFSRASKNGSNNALLELGNLFYYGFGVETDFAKAAECYEKVKQLECEEGLFNLGCLYLSDLVDQGISVESRESLLAAKIFYCMSQAANKNHLEAKFALGSIYHDGIGTSVNLDKALENYFPKALAGNPEAQSLYACCLIEKGEYDLAYNWLERAAEHGNQDAKMKLKSKEFKTLYSISLINNGNHEKAFNYLKRIEGEQKAHVRMAQFYLQEKPGVQLDGERAIFHLEKLLPFNDPKVYCKLGYCYYSGKGGIEIDFEKAVSYYHTAADELNSELAIQNLGSFYLAGIGVKQDKNKAKDYFLKVAENFHPDFAVSQYHLACLYSEGEVVEIDMFKALYYCKKSADRNFPYAKKKLGDFYTSFALYFCQMKDQKNFEICSNLAKSLGCNVSKTLFGK